MLTCVGCGLTDYLFWWVVLRAVASDHEGGFNGDPLGEPDFFVVQEVGWRLMECGRVAASRPGGRGIWWLELFMGVWGRGYAAPAVRRGVRDETMVSLRKEQEGEFSRVFSISLMN